MATRKRQAAGAVTAKQLDRMLAEIRRAGTLKRIPRMGWQMRGVIPCESVADHSFRVIYIAMLLADALVAAGEQVDATRIIRMAIVHELPESLLTDLAKDPVDLLGKRAKFTAEDIAVRRITEGLVGGGGYYALWREFEEMGSLEAKAVRMADRLDMMVQACDYEAVGWRNLDDFWKNTANCADYGVPLFAALWRRFRAVMK